MAGEVRPADSPSAASRRGRGDQDDPPCECSGKAPWLEDRISPMGREVSLMRYRPSQARYTGGGQVKYLVYRSPQPLRTGHVQDRTRVRRLYFPASATAITVQGPQTLPMRTGRQVCGVAVHYRHQLRGTTVHRDQTTYPLPPRWAERTKVVALPQGAKELTLTDQPPKGPLMAVT